MQFDTVSQTGKEPTVECRHCKNKRLARSVASRKVKHLQRCPPFHRYLAGLAATNDEELNHVPPELLLGPQTPTLTRQFDMPLPTLLDGLGSGRLASAARRESSTPLDEIRDWNHREDNHGDNNNNNDTVNNEPAGNDGPDDTTMVEASTTITSPPSDIQTTQQRQQQRTARQHQRQAAQAPGSVPERAVAFAHRAAQRRKDKLDNVITRAIYQGSLPFNINDASKHPAMAEFFRLVDYMPPNRLRIADDVYDHTHQQSDDIIDYAS
jgi:hypothetical protein